MREGKEGWTERTAEEGEMSQSRSHRTEWVERGRMTS